MTCTDEQVRLLIKYAATHPQQIAAAKAGMSFSTAKRYLAMKGKKEPKPKPPRHWQTHKDAFAAVWPELETMLVCDSGLEARTLMSWLMETYPGQFHAAQERTLRRRVREWRILKGPERKEVMFPQNIQPGMQSQSDYTHCNKLDVKIAGEPFPHMVFHFMLPYSRWEFVWICFSESFETLSTGFGRAVRELGAVAPEHRTDNLAAAVPIGEGPHVFQQRWSDFLEHFGVHPSANTPGHSNENGSVEKSHHLFKHAIDQRLRLRGSREFATVEEYDRFLQVAVQERNRQRQERLSEEMDLLKALPENEWSEPQQYAATVTAWSTMTIAKATYSVPSRFIGQRLRALADYERVRVFFGKHLVLEVPRKESGGKCINYRHLIFHLLRKPGAFRNYQFREELFPRLVFRRAYDALLIENDEKADKEYLRILNQAALAGEDAIATILLKLLDGGKLPTSELVRVHSEAKKAVPAVRVAEPKLDGYDKLLSLDLRKEFNQ